MSRLMFAALLLTSCAAEVAPRADANLKASHSRNNWCSNYFCD